MLRSPLPGLVVLPLEPPDPLLRGLALLGPRRLRPRHRLRQLLLPSRLRRVQVSNLMSKACVGYSDSVENSYLLYKVTHQDRKTSH